MLRFLIYLLPLSILSQTPSNFEIGQRPSDKILNIEMINIDDKLYSLNNLSSNNGLLIIFSSNTCPFVLMWQDRYKIIERLCKENELGLVYINSNSKNRNDVDSHSNMKNYHLNNNLEFPYLLDENNIIADYFDAKTTPHIFLMNNNYELVYKGAIDDNYKSYKDVTNFYINDAIINMINKKPLTLNYTKPVGCSIKRLSDK